MSNYLAVAAITSALRKQILDGLNSATWDFAYDLVVTTTPPDLARTAGLEAMGQVNLFLYHVGPNPAWRNEALPRQTKGGESGFPPLAIDLRYLITSYAPDNDGIEAHRILGRALSVLHDHPVLSAAQLAGALPNADVHEQMERIRLTPLALSTEEMSSLWSCFQKPYNLSVAWQVSVVLIDSARPTRAPLPVLTRGAPDPGTADRGVVVAAQMGPFAPGIESIAPPAQQASVRLGETLRVAGYLLAGDLVRANVSHSRWASDQQLTPVAVSPLAVSVQLPSGSAAEAAWPAGVYTLSLRVTRRLGDPEVVTNELPFALSPSITSISPAAAAPDAGGSIALTVKVSPQVRPAQRVALIVGDRSFTPAALSTQSDTLELSLDGLAPGKHRLRLRVDGVDSVVVDKTTTPPSFTGHELEVL